MMELRAHRSPKLGRPRVERACVRMVAGLAGVVASCLGPEGAFAAGRAIEDIRISREGAAVTAELAFPCAVRYLSHTPRETGASFQIRLALEEGCRAELGTGLRSELYQPQGREIAGIHEVAFHTDASDGAILIVSFDQSTTVEVDQGRSRNLIRLVVETERRRLTQVPTLAPGATPNERSAVEVPLPRPSASPPLPQVDVSPPAPEAETPERETETPDREPLRLVQPVPFQPTDRFVVQLATDPADSADYVLPDGAEDRTLYVNDVTAGSRN